jgi:hypothetical protein
VLFYEKFGLGQEVTEALADYALPILSVRIMQRVLYPTTAASGTTVLDVEPQGEAAGIHVRRDELVSVMYSTALNSTTSLVPPQRTDRHGILDEKPPYFQRLSR